MARTKINGDQLGTAGGAWTAWTPTITTLSGAFTTVSATGRYSQIGKLINYKSTVTVTNKGTATSVIFSLPVTSAALTNPYMGNGRENAATGKSLQVFGQNTTTAHIFDYTGADVAVTGYVLEISGSYEAA